MEDNRPRIIMFMEALEIYANLMVFQMASFLVIVGYTARFSPKPEAGVPLILLGYLILAIIYNFGLLSLFTGTLHPSSPTYLKFGSLLDYAISLTQIHGMTLCLFSVFTASDGEIPLAGFGLAGGLLLYIGGVLNFLKFRKYREIQ